MDASADSRAKEKGDSHEPKKIVVNLMALLVLASVPAFGAGGDKGEVKGMITARAGETLIMKSDSGTTTTVVLRPVAPTTVEPRLKCWSLALGFP
jgi:hypothetical protein